VVAHTAMRVVAVAANYLAFGYRMAGWVVQ